MRFDSRKHHLALAAVFSLLLACGAKAQPPATPSLDSEENKTLYALGLAVGQNLGNLNLTEAELEVVKAGLTDAALKREAKVKLQEYGPKIQAFAKGKQEAAVTVEKAEAAKFLEKMAAEPGAKKTDSGLIITEITAGTGASPAATDKVTVHYHGTLRDGTVFDSSRERNQPATFGLNQVIPCWTEGVQMMKVGGKSKLVCPASIAYGDQGRPSIPGGATLVFEVELISIEGK